MSIISECYFGVLLDHQTYLQQVYQNCRSNDDSALTMSYKMNQQYFDVPKPYFAKNDKSSEVLSLRNRKKRKRKLEKNAGEIKAEIFHRKIELKVKTAFEAIIQSQRNNNFGSKNIYVSNGLSMKQNDIERSRFNLLSRDFGLFGNDSSESIVVSTLDEKFLIPSNCRFLQSDIFDIEPLLVESATMGCYDVIIMDPPWENKSAKRGRKYDWLSTNQILQIPIEKLLSNNGYLAVWVTNKQKIRNFVIDELFPKNSVEFFTSWVWIKVTNSYEPVIDFESEHKKPYEILIIGKKHSQSNSSGKTFSKDISICSVPCSIHSHKPPLDRLVRKYLVPHLRRPKCLELFARSLMPGWASCGNEVLKLQNVKYFDKIVGEK